MKKLIETFRWKLADRLSKWAVRLRGQKWYLNDNWAQCYSNEAGELQQEIWERTISLTTGLSPEEKEVAQNIAPRLERLAQLAGENWAHLK
jgi:hypothetical protein